MLVPWWPFVVALIATIGAAVQIRRFRMEDARFRMERRRLRLMEAQRGVSKERVEALRRWVEDNGLPLYVDDFGRLHARRDDGAIF